jgi:hypothetical protein
VEEAFSDMRTKNDLRTLSECDAFADAKAQNRVPTRDEMDAVRIRCKLSKLHSVALFEIYALRYLSGNLDGNKAWRLWVKKRIYIKNEDALADILEDKELVKSKIHETFLNVLADYERFLVV